MVFHSPASLSAAFYRRKQLAPACQVPGIIVLTELLVLVAQQHVGLRELGLWWLRFLLIINCENCQ